jgi:hypothetical protein
MTSPPTEDLLPIVTLEEHAVPIEILPDDEQQTAPDGLQEHLLAPTWVRRIVPTRKAVGLDQLRDELDKVQSQIDTILQTVRSPQVSAGKVRLTGVQVSLGITASGSIGVVTAGMEASLTLVYERA